MDVEKTMEFILEQKAHSEAERAKIAAQQKATVKLIKVGMRLISPNAGQIKEHSLLIKENSERISRRPAAKSANCAPAKTSPRSNSSG
jgi:hypothetical protein